MVKYFMIFYDCNNFHYFVSEIKLETDRLLINQIQLFFYFFYFNALKTLNDFCRSLPSLGQDAASLCIIHVSLPG